MAQSAIASPAPIEQSRADDRPVFPLAVVLLALGALWFVVCRHLSAEWSYNEQYNYGWFVPFFALYLFWLRWEDRPKAEVSLRPRGAYAPAGGQRFATANPSFGGSEVSGQRSEVRNDRRGLIAAVIAIPFLLLLLPLRLIEGANPDWRPISWVHAIAVVLLTLLLIWYIGGKPWLRHFAFPVMFVLVAVPWITPIEDPIVQKLMPVVASIATETLSLFGIPAEVQGNLIRINDGMVGVNEACSGVRSLQTSIMIGLLFGELKRLRVGQRILLVAAAVGIAFLANCGRAFFLVWIAATRGVPQVEHWHDIAGYAIVALVFFGCLGVTALLARSAPGGQQLEVSGQMSAVRGQNTDVRGQPSDVSNQRLDQEGSEFRIQGSGTSQPPASNSKLSPSRRALRAVGRAPSSKLQGQMSDVRGQTSDGRVEALKSNFGFRISDFGFPRLSFPIAALCWLLLIEGGVELWYRAHERNLRPSMQWSVRWPESAPDFHEMKIDERTRTILHNDEGRGATWRDARQVSGISTAASGDATSLLYFFRWRPGHNSALLANAHRPDVCLPATGWRQTGDFGVRSYEVTRDFAIPFRHFEFASEGSGRKRSAHAFYCVWEDRVSQNQPGSETRGLSENPSTWTRSERVQAVLDGRRHLGQQVVEYLRVEPREIGATEAEQAFAAEVPQLILPAAAQNVANK